MVPEERTNTLIVTAPPAAMTIIEGLINDVDSNVGPQAAVKQFTLKNADAAIAAKELASIFVDAATGQSRLRAGSRDKISVTADERTNTLLITAPPEAMESVENAVKELDGNTAPESTVRTFPLKFADAATAAKALAGVFVDPATGQSRLRLGSRDKVSATADPRTNSILVTAPEEAMPLVEKTVRDLDASPDGGAEVKFFHLKQGDADATAKLILGFFKPADAAATDKRPPDAVHFGVNAVADPRTNTVAVTAPPEAMATVDQLVREVEEAPSTVVRDRIVHPEERRRGRDRQAADDTVPARRARHRGARRRPPAQGLAGQGEGGGGGGRPDQHRRRDRPAGDAQGHRRRHETAGREPGLRGADPGVPTPERRRAGRRQAAGVDLRATQPPDHRHHRDRPQAAGRDRRGPPAGLDHHRLRLPDQHPHRHRAPRSDEGRRRHRPPDRRQPRLAGDLLHLPPAQRAGAEPGSRAEPTVRQHPGREPVELAPRRQRPAPEFPARRLRQRHRPGCLRQPLRRPRLLGRPRRRLKRRLRLPGAASAAGGTGIGARRGTVNGLGGGAGTPSLSSGLARVATELTGQVYVVADPDTNSLLVTTATRYQQEVRAIINELDHPVPQVLIKVLIAEVTHDNSSDLGTDFSILDMRKNGNGSSLVQNLGNAAAASANGGLAVSVVENNVTATLHALAAVDKLDVLSRPYILASDNQLASITIGNEVPFITDTRLTETGQTINTIQYQDVGIILNVTPHINPEGLVILDVAPEISQITAQTVPISAGVNAPIIAKRAAESRVGIKNGQTVVIGGLMEDRKTDSVTKVPFLGDIPILGEVFRRTQTTKSKTELLIFLTPHVAPQPDALRSMSQDEMGGTKLMNKAIDPATFGDQMRNLRRGAVPDTRPSAATQPIIEFAPSTTQPGAPDQTGPATTGPIPLP